MIMNPMMIMAVNKNQKEPFLGVRQSRGPCESLPSLSHLFGNDDDDDAVKYDVDDHNMFLCYNLIFSGDDKLCAKCTLHPVELRGYYSSDLEWLL